MKKITCILLITIILVCLFSFTVSAESYYDDDYYYSDSSVLEVEIGVGVAALVVTIIIVVVAVKKMNNTKSPKSASRYSVDSKTHLDFRRDIFLYSTTTKTKINNDNNRK